MPEQQYYVPTVSAEPKPKHPGRTEGIIAIICAAVSLLFFPIIFGSAGIILGIFSHKKGEKTFGLVAIILSAIFMVIGIIMGVYVQLNLKGQLQGAGGFLFPLLR